MEHARNTIVAGLLVLLAGAAAALVTPSAMAQNALGDGRGLERDRRVGGTGNYRPPDFADEVRRRNAIITGNAPGASNFRGDVGYRAPGEFVGRLGSDDVFAFRRDSFWSGAAGMGLRGTESLQYQYSFTTGNVRSARLAELVLGRDAAPAMNAAEVSTSRRFVEDEALSALGSGWRRAGAELGTLRSTAAFTASRPLSPMVVGVVPTATGLETTAASTLLGIRSWLTPMQRDVEVRREAENLIATGPRRRGTAGDALRDRLGALGPELVRTPLLRPELATPVPGASQPSPAAPTPTPDATTPPSPGSATPSPAGSVPAAPSSSAPAPGAGTSTRLQLPAWEQRLQELRRQLQQRPDRDAVLESLRARQTGMSADEIERRRRERDAQLLGLSPEAASQPLLIDAETLRLLREARLEVDRYMLANPDAADVYADQMRQGEAAMAAGKFFQAEEAFARALSFVPGDPTAMAGRLHAQIGAALFLSAGLNLREMYRESPEMVVVRFTGATLPTAERQARIIELLRARRDANIAAGMQPPTEVLLLLAYLGRQRGDDAMMREALDALATIEPTTTDTALPPLVSLLRRVWLMEDPVSPPAPAVDPAPFPAPPAP